MGTDGEDSQEENEKRISCIPKKRFEWNDSIRLVFLFYDVNCFKILHAYISLMVLPFYSYQLHGK